MNRGNKSEGVPSVRQDEIRQYCTSKQLHDESRYRVGDCRATVFHSTDIEGKQLHAHLPLRNDMTKLDLQDQYCYSFGH